MQSDFQANINLAGQTILVTGASRGIGAAIAKRFAQNGDRVFAGYRVASEQAMALAEEYPTITPVQADLAVLEEVARLAEACGEVDVLINNAGIALPQKCMQEVTPEEYDRLFAVNVRGMFLLTKALIPGMIRRKSGSIVNLSSVWGVDGGSCEVPYSMTKAAVIGFTKSLAKELGPSGIRVNCVAPGVIDTAMNGALSQADRNALAEETPLGRIGTAKEVADAVFFLSGEQASFITGQILAPNGGFSI